ncbi:hypothetical protein HER39_14055, partial [Arthrobacter deserti]|nr:hypothetical protein [Arthrobacter deserti]
MINQSRARFCPVRQNGGVPQSDFSFTVGQRLSETAPRPPAGSGANGGPFLGRTGPIATPHGQIQTPAFIAVGTKATAKAVLPESMRDLGAQALLANAY